MLKNLEYPAKREILPQMLSIITDEIKKYFHDDKWINRLKICAEEILINIIDYSKSEKVYVSCGLTDDEKAMRFEFADTGTPYNPLEKKPEIDIDAEIDERQIGGLGIFLYTTIMDKLEYRYEGGKNYLVATKNLSCEVN